MDKDRVLGDYDWAQAAAKAAQREADVAYQRMYPSDQRIGWSIEEDGRRVYMTQLRSQGWRPIYGTMDEITAALAIEDMLDRTQPWID